MGTPIFWTPPCKRIVLNKMIWLMRCIHKYTSMIHLWMIDPTHLDENMMTKFFFSPKVLGPKFPDFTSRSISMALPASDVCILDAQDYFGFALANFFVGKTLMWVSLFMSRFGCGCLFHRFVCKPHFFD